MSDRSRDVTVNRSVSPVSFFTGGVLMTRTHRTTALFAAVLMATIMAAPAFAATFDPVNDELSNPTIVDDFDGDLSKWDASAGITIISDLGENWLQSAGNEDARLKSAFRITLPTVGELTVIETRIKGKSNPNGNVIEVSNGDGTSLAQIEAESNTYKFRTKAGETQQTSTLGAFTTTFSSSTPDDVLRFVFDNTSGNKEIGIYVKKGGDTTYQLLETSGGTTATASNAWDNSDPFYVDFSTFGGATRMESDFVRFQTIPEPASLAMGLVGFGALALRRRRRA